MSLETHPARAGARALPARPRIRTVTAGHGSPRDGAWSTRGERGRDQAAVAVTAGAAGAGRDGACAPGGADEEGHRRDDVGEPREGLEPGGGGREVEDALEDRAVPAARRDGRGDVEREVVQAGQDAGLLQVVDAVGEHAGRDDDEEQPGPGEERAQVELERAAVDEPAEQHGGDQAERGADQRRGVRRACRGRCRWSPARRPTGTGPSPGPRARPRAGRRRARPSDRHRSRRRACCAGRPS